MRAMAFPCLRSLQLVSLLVAFHAALDLARPASAGAAVLPDIWCTNGRVEAQVVHNQTLYVGGGFDMVGPPTGGAAVLDEASGVVQSPFPRVDGSVFVVKPDGIGGWYLGGEFESVQGFPRKNLAHIDAGGAVTPWSLEVNDLVWTIAVGNGTVFVGGMFDSIAGQPRGGVAAIDQASGFLTTWNPTVTGFISGAGGSSVKSIVLSGDKVYLGGSFTTVAGFPRPGFAEVDAATGIPTSWAVGSGSVNAMILSGTNLYLGTGTNVSGNVRVFDIATRDSLSVTQFTGNVNALVEDPGTGVVYVGGFFNSAGGIPRTSLAALAGPLGGVTAWNPVMDGLVFGLALSGTDGLVVGGNFQSLGGQSRRYLGSVSRTTGAVLPLAPRPGATVRSVAVRDGRIYVGGIFTLMNGVERYRLAALDVTTGLPTAWAPNPVPLSGGVYSMFLHGSTLYVGGDFSQLEGQSRNGAGAFDLTTGTLTAWDPNVQGGRVLAIDVFDFFGSITVYLAGDFDQVGGWSRGHLAAVDAVSGAVTSFGDARLNGPAWAVYRDRSVLPSSAAVYVAGSFTASGVFSRNRLAAFYPVDGFLLPWDPNADGLVEDLLPVTDGSGAVTKFYLAGSFTSVGGQPRRGLAEIGVSGAVTAWNPDVTGSVADIERVGETIYAGGLFTAVGGQARQNLAAVNAVNGTVLSWNPKASSPPGSQAAVRSVVNRSTFMHVGGEFRNVGGASLGNLATIGGTVTSVEGTDRAPAAPHALRAAPNPFGGETALHFSLTRRDPVVISVYDVAGRLVRDLHQGTLGPGSYQVPWDGRDGGGRLVGSGVYVLRLKSPTANVSSKVFRLK